MFPATQRFSRRCSTRAGPRKDCGKLAHGNLVRVLHDAEAAAGTIRDPAAAFRRPDRGSRRRSRRLTRPHAGPAAASADGAPEPFRGVPRGQAAGPAGAVRPARWSRLAPARGPAQAFSAASMTPRSARMCSSAALISSPSTAGRPPASWPRTGRAVPQQVCSLAAQHAIQRRPVSGLNRGHQLEEEVVPVAAHPSRSARPASGPSSARPAGVR